MRSHYEIKRQLAHNQQRLQRKRDKLITDALNAMDEDDEYEEVRDGAIVAFEDELEAEQQIRHDKKYHNDVREHTVVTYIHLGTVRRRSGSKVHLYGTVVEGATRIAQGKERNEKDENGLKNKYTTLEDDNS